MPIIDTSGIRNPLDDFPNPFEGVEKAFRESVLSVNNELDRIAEDIKKKVDEGTGIAELKKIADYLKEELEKLSDMTKLGEIIEKIIDEGEKTGEEYLKTKLSMIEELGFVANPDLEINFKDNKNIELELYIYCVYNELGQVDEQSKSHLILSSNLTYDIFQPFNMEKVYESAKMNVKFNEDSVKQAVEDKIESKKEELIKSFIEEFFSDYIDIFSTLKNLIELIK